MLTHIEQIFIRTNETTDDIKNLVSRFDGISLKNMNKYALMNRVDTKFVLTQPQLITALTRLSGSYWILDINSVRMNHYQTVYFDTANFDLYHEHINRGQQCYKVRTRSYVESELSFLEVKYKNQKKRTIKNRVKTELFNSEIDGEDAAFLMDYTPYPVQNLAAKLWNTFTRLTLVSKTGVERITIDLELSFHNEQKQVNLPDIVIAEVKQEGFSLQSDFMKEMRKQGIRSTGFSKYCVGTSLLYDQVKKNRVKPKMLMMHKLQKGVCYG